MIELSRSQPRLWPDHRLSRRLLCSDRRYEGRRPGRPDQLIWRSSGNPSVVLVDASRWQLTGQRGTAPGSPSLSGLSGPWSAVKEQHRKTRRKPSRSSEDVGRLRSGPATPRPADAHGQVGGRRLPEFLLLTVGLWSGTSKARGGVGGLSVHRPRWLSTAPRVI